MELHHVGIATRDVDALASLFADLLGMSVVHEEQVDGMRVVFLRGDGGGRLELLEPAADGPIATYLDRHGPGIHHLALSTADVAAALERARELGAEPIDDAPRPGAWGHEVAFLHPDSTGGVLLEFVAASQ
ncbi:methylmalonyl-CoA epimerase [Halopenitus persicus]|uniref:Methylmalonyl-CoA epimerase n=1 Tax=Halopenitus persicus TaxID=1048396 RepID=A0A1H3HCW8_9EURY|nr:methylmalonyl-CoA epimerase [Halopenitus persicus]QHS16019.1 methylmalonyl-CoA epimerase [haloarchaeon 3A1-DGR]SDY13170.1 methylmalonyl-CoA epimerase [Halopenitus persicus]